ncbi:MAG: hypothetical protein MJD61_20610, partial [Proteobacteria bacterium]|nr:hypothetical protein [Pseudomonadota bacterium]
HTSEQHCGFCGSVCQFPNASEDCISGVCTLTNCSSGRFNCDGNPFNGCESTFPCPHIGGQGQCQPGRANCDFVGSCETNLLTSEQNCGFCGAVCQLPRANERCVSGICTITSCNSGWNDCDRNPLNGCERQGPC